MARGHLVWSEVVEPNMESSKQVTFPKAFPSVPTVICTVGNDWFTVQTDNVNASGFKVWVRNMAQSGGGNKPQYIDWLAIA